MITVYGIKNCDTMKKAFAWLESNGIAYTFVDYKKAGVAESHLPDWIKRAGWETLLNTRGLMWKKLTDEERAVGLECVILPYEKGMEITQKELKETGSDISERTLIALQKAKERL